MYSVILTVTARYLFPVLLLFSVFLLLRGHHEPGGGFTGGLVAACAYALLAFSSGGRSARQAVPVSPDNLMGSGLLIALLSGLPGLMQGDYLKAFWFFSGGPSVGTPLVFDVGVYLVVLGVILKALLTMMEDEA